MKLHIFCYKSYSICSTRALNALLRAATGHMGFCLLPQVQTLIIDAAQTFRAVQVGICNRKESKKLGTADQYLLDTSEQYGVFSKTVVHSRFTDWQAVELCRWSSLGDRQCRTGLTVAFGLLAINNQLLQTQDSCDILG